MDWIIDFLKNNIFIVVIVVGFVVSLFNKSKRGGSSRMPDFSGRTAAPESNQQPAEQSQLYRPEIASNTVIMQSAQYADRKSELEEDRHSHRVLNRMGDLSSFSNAADLQPVREVETFRMPEGEELRRAIIVAEILGPPRSKRPFRPRI